jgi:hypothetical protein
MRSRLRWKALLVVLAALVAARCSNEPAASMVAEGTTTGAGMEIGFSFDDPPPTTGDNAISVTVRKDGAAVSDATITTMFSMPAMPSMNMPEMHSSTTLQPAGEGRYRGVGELSMSGTWNVRVTVTQNGRELGTRTFSIVAK